MKTPTNHRPILDAVLEETAPGDYREAVLRNTLRAVHRRQGRRTAGRILAGVVGLVILACLLEPWRTPSRQAVRPVSSPLTMISSHPLNRSLIAETKPGALTIVHSSPGTVAVVHTISMSDRLSLVNDDQLLALLADYGAVLVRHHPQDPARLFVTSTGGHDAPME